MIDASADMTDAPAAQPDAAQELPDASAPVPDAMVEMPDAMVEMPDASMMASGETCGEAIDLASVTTVLDSPVISQFTNRVQGSYGAVDDYDPRLNDNKPPDCSFSYYANGNEVAYSLILQPGQTLTVYADYPEGSTPHARMAVYLLDTCDPPHVLDHDNNGFCGNTDYFVMQCLSTYCSFDVNSLPTFTYPADASGPATLWLVVDEVTDQFVPELKGSQYNLYWRID